MEFYPVSTSFILIIIGSLFFIFLYNRRKQGKEIKNKENTIVYVEHRGFTLTMTQWEKENYWDNLYESEKNKQVVKTKNAVRAKVLVMAYVPSAGKWATMSRPVAEKYGYKIADHRLRNSKELQDEGV